MRHFENVFVFLPAASIHHQIYIWGCISGGVYVLYIYMHARWELQ